MRSYFPACSRSATWSFTVVAAFAFALTACSEAGGGSATGGSSSTGGSQGIAGGSGGEARGGNTALGGAPATGGVSSNGGSSPTTGGAANSGSGGSMPVTGGVSSGGEASGGSAGSVAGGGAAGAAGSNSAGQGGSTVGAGAGGGAGVGGGAGKAGVARPANATFCSGFEAAGLPPGAVYKLNGDPATPWTHDFEVDTTQHNSGNSSLRVKTNSESSGAYKMLAVPAPGAAFWARFYIRSDVDLGASDHNVYAYAAGSDNPNDSTFVEFAEDVGLAFNSHDIVRWPNGFGRLSGGGTMPFTLPKHTWHCIEISFDGQARVQKLSINGTQQINATDYPAAAAAFTTFKFGYNALHGTVRKTWYDDVAVAPAAIGCL